MKKSLALLFVFSAIPSVCSAAPVLERLEPSGGQRGQAVKLSLIGTGLTSDAEILTTLPGGIAALTPPKQEGREELEIPFLVELPDDAPIDTYPVRIRTKDGLSNALLFTIGAFSETVETESRTELDEPLNDSLETAQSISTPITVNGTLGPSDRDYYRIEAQAGERLVFEVEARRIGSAIDPTLHVMDFEGNTVARSEDALGLGVDARVEVIFDRNGPYFVEVHEAQYGAYQENSYRLKVGDFSYADGMFPLGWQNNGKTKVALFGGNLGKQVVFRPDLTGIDKNTRVTRISVPGKPGALPINFVVGTDQETFEPKKITNRTLEPNVLTNGRIAKTEEVDRYALAVEAGETWHVAIDSTSLGTSSLYALLTLYDEKGTKLASAGDVPPKGNIYSGLRASDPGEDPFVVLTIPEKTRKLTVTVEDLLGRGGREFGYRLLAKKEPGDFEMTVTTPYVNIPERGTAQLSVIVKRRGYGGAIQIEIPNLPNDIEMSGGNLIPFASGSEGGIQNNTATVTLTPKPGAEARLLNLEVWGAGKRGDGSSFRRHALVPILITNRKILGEVREKQFIEAPMMELAVPATVTTEEPAVIDILTPRFVRLIMGQSHELLWSFHARQPGIQPPKQVDMDIGIATFVNRGDQGDYAKDGTLTLVTTESAGFGTNFQELPMRFDMLVYGTIKSSGKKHIIHAPAVTVEMVLGYGVKIPTEITLHPGGLTTLVGSVTREPGFDSPIDVNLEGLPAGVTCQQTQITTADQFELSCEANNKTEAGHHNIQITASSRLPGSDAKHVPLRMKPIEALLKIEDSKSTVASVP